MKLPVFIALAILISLSGGAQAQTKKAASASAKKAKAVTGDESEQPKLAPKKERVSKIEAINEDEIADLEEQLIVIDDKIQVTKKEISKIRDATYLPDLYFALADMYTQKSRVMYILKTQKNVGKNPDTIDFTGEKRPKQEAIDIYQKVYSFFPKEKRRDKALFLMGLEQRDLGLFEQMIKTFSTLSKEFPMSDHFNEANIILGDYFFEQKKDVAGAIEIYKKVAERPLSAFTPLAHYRIGWCHMNELKYELAVKAYEEALSTQAQTNPDELPEMYRKTDIRREAVFALAVPYVELFTDPEKKRTDLPPPVDYFREKSPDHFTYRRVLSRAGRRLILKERWKEAADSFYNVEILSTDFDTRFEALQRVNEANKRNQLQIDFLPVIKEIAITIDLLQAQLEKPLVFDANAMKRLGDPAKQNPKAKTTPQLKALNQLQFLETLMRDFSTKLHAKARSSGSPLDFDQAAEAYQSFLDRFPVAPKALDIHYNLAEALFKGDHPVRAGMQYEVLANEKRLAKKSNTFKESALESYTKALQNFDQLSSVEKIRARRGLRAVGAAWLKDNPKAPGAPTAAFNIANSWYEERNLKKAIESFKDFIKKYPSDARVRDAIFLTINSYSQMDDYKGLQSSGEQLIKTAGLSEEDKNTIRDAIRRAQTKQLQTVAGDFGSKEYAQNLLSVASKYKNSALGVEALHEAFLSLRGKNDPELFDVGEALLEQHADSQYAKEVSSTLATLSLTTASFDRAAKYLSRFAAKYPNEKEAVDFKKTAAVLFERQGDFKRARELYVALGNRAAVARMDLLLNDWPSLEKSSLQSGMREAKYWHALAIWRQRRYQDAVPLLRTLVSERGAAPDQVGHARFLLTQLSLERFRQIQMKSAEDQQALLNKVNAFKALSQELQGLIQSGAGRWPIASLYLLGQTHYDLGRFIADSPLPGGLSAADKKTYIGELNKQAGAYIAEANKVFAKCIETAQANDIFTRYVDGCRGKGQKAIREEDDLAKPPAKTAGAEPRDARLIRKKLFEKNSDVNLLFALAETYIRADQPQTAAGILASILEKDANNARALAAIGVTSLYTNEFDSAYESFKKALEADPKNPTALYNLAGLYKQFGFTAKLAALRVKMKGVNRPKLLHPFGKGI